MLQAVNFAVDGCLRHLDLIGVEQCVKRGFFVAVSDRLVQLALHVDLQLAFELLKVAIFNAVAFTNSSSTLGSSPRSSF